MFLITVLFKAHLVAHWLYILGLNVCLYVFRPLLASLRYFHQLKDFSGLLPSKAFRIVMWKWCIRNKFKISVAYNNIYCLLRGLQVGCVALFQIMGSGSGFVSCPAFSIQAEGVPPWGTSFSHGERRARAKLNQSSTSKTSLQIWWTSHFLTFHWPELL